MSQGHLNIVSSKTVLPHLQRVLVDLHAGRDTVNIQQVEPGNIILSSVVDNQLFLPIVHQTICILGVRVSIG